MILLRRQRMIKQKQRVVGSYKDEKEAERVIRHLLAQGFQNKQLTIYTNKEKHPFNSEDRNIEVTQPDIEKTKSNDKSLDDKNFWTSIRDAFHIRKDHEFDHSNYRPESDLLAPYREDLRDGFYIVTIDDSKDNL